jgi:hypothetical protein
MTATLPPPPPPPPAPGTLDAKAARKQMQALKKQQREFRRERTVARVKGVHPSVWAAAGIGLVLVGGAVGCQRVQSSQAEFQRDTALALASLREPATATSQPPAATVQGMENPLEQWLDDTGTVKLTPQAVWTIGPTADGSGLLPGRSTLVMRQILESADVCRLFIRLDDQNLPRITKEPGAGAVPLVECTKPATSTTKPAAPPSSTTPTTVGG